MENEPFVTRRKRGGLAKFVMNGELLEARWTTYFPIIAYTVCCHLAVPINRVEDKLPLCISYLRIFFVELQGLVSLLDNQD